MQTIDEVKKRCCEAWRERGDADRARCPFHSGDDERARCPFHSITGRV